jgi:hypothetical protein
MHSKNVIVDIDMAIVLKVTQCFDAIVGSFDFSFTRATTNTSMWLIDTLPEDSRFTKKKKLIQL